MMIKFLMICFTISSVYSKNELYKGYRIYNINIETVEQENKLKHLKSDLVDFLNKPSLKFNANGRAMVPPSHIEWFEEKLDEINVVKDIAVDDVYKYINDREITSRNGTMDAFDFNGYHRYDKILDYMKSIETEYANSSQISIQIVEAGTTDENRPLVYIKITANTSVETTKGVVVIEAGINPREWITIPAALNIINRTIEGNQSRLLENLEWIIIPVLNPDGYEYTHTNVRLWTKSRSTRSNLGHICPGVNINRNFDIDWLFSDSSSSPCSHLYGGTEAFSEPETKLIRTLIEEYEENIKLYISIQNNGGFISYPWQYERAASGMFRHHHMLGLDMVNAMGDGYNLDIGSVALGDRTSGTSTDYVMDRGVLYTFNINVQNDGIDGVIIPESEIIPIADKVWNAVAIAAERIIIN